MRIHLIQQCRLTSMLDGVLCNHPLLVSRDDIDTHAARLRTDSGSGGVIGMLVEDDAKPGTAGADVRGGYFWRMLADLRLDEPALRVRTSIMTPLHSP
jgi:hypothetical protein